MNLNGIERAAMNNPLPATHETRREARWFARLGGVSVTGTHVLEVERANPGGVEPVEPDLDAHAAALNTAT